MLDRLERGDIAVLRLAHGRASALDLELLIALREEVGAVRGSGARALVLTGSGTIFSAGVDLFRLVDGGAAYAEAFLPALRDALHALLTLELPVVAAINGHAIAGGAVLAAACDRRIMARGTGRIGVPELLVGVPFPALALEIVRAVAPGPLAQDLAFTGRRLTPEEALDRGLVDEVVAAEELDGRARQAAERLAALAPAAFGLTKRMLRRPVLERAARLAGELDAEVARAWARPETREAIRAYLDATLGPGRAAPSQPAEGRAERGPGERDLGRRDLGKRGDG